MENIRKVIIEKSDVDAETVLAPVQAYFAKQDCTTLLNKLCQVQAFHNNVNLNKLEGISKDPKTGQSVISNPNDRKVVAKQFEKHVI